MTRWSALRALGAKRGWKAKVIPIALTLVAFFPVLIVLGLRALFASSINDNLATVLPYSDYAGIVGLVILVFAVVVTPELLCPDRRDGTLALYFATAISRTDYVARQGARGAPAAAARDRASAGDPLRRERALRDPSARLRPGSHCTTSPASSPPGSRWRSSSHSSASRSRRSPAGGPSPIGGYLAFLIVPTIVGGILSNNIEHGENLRLMAFAAVPIHAAESLYPVYT